MNKRFIALVLCISVCIGMLSMFTGCKNKKDDGAAQNAAPDAFVIMTEQLDGLFNPFFSTSANDGTIVAMTQIGMLSSKYEGGEVKVAYGDNEAVVVKDYEIVENSDTTTYLFVLKNGIKFSDGHPLTMEDVLFNYYVYLDPVYTGSSTLYSTKIDGLEEYRTQTLTSDTSGSDSQLAAQASSRAQQRINELLNLYIGKRNSSATGEVSIDDMTAAILASNPSSGYKSAISADASSVTSANLLEDYNYTLKLFKEELTSDYNNCQDSYSEEPYKSHAQFQNEIFRFMFTEGYVEIKYAKGADGKDDRTKIETLTPKYSESAINSKEAAIDYIYNDKVASALDEILLYWATASTLSSEYSAQAKQVILQENVKEDGSLLVPNIRGIVSLGHTDKAGTTIKVNGTDYTIASGHNSDGTVTNASEYDVLEITIKGIDPKAIWNFAISVAPQHYYGEGSSVGVDIANNKFGVQFADFSFMSKIIQSPRNVKLPMGAGSYKVTDANNSDNPSENEFYKNNVVYFKANNYFETVGSGINNAKIEKVRYQIVSSNNAIGALESGSVHYISPALTNTNYEKLEQMSSKGYVTLSSDQLGYGYIGINASKVNDINLRKALMYAMNTSLALDYYRAGTAERIFWNMSTVSWAYPTGSDRDDNHKGYPQIGSWDEEQAKRMIQTCMEAAGVSGGEDDLRITFTIAGSTLQDHPTYKVFRDAATLLNSMGWDIKVICDPQALTKISTGSLEVWAAAWSSALDPDMYQVYHKDSTATSTLAWGYNYIKTSGSDEEREILDNLSELIDAARETNDREDRASYYKDAMGYVLDLAVELPVYQRDVLYAFNANVINKDSVSSEVNPYSSPLDRIWELEFVS